MLALVTTWVDSESFKFLDPASFYLDLLVKGCAGGRVAYLLQISLWATTASVLPKSRLVRDNLECL